MAHRSCPSCGAFGLRVTPVLRLDDDHAVLRCASCRLCWRIDRKQSTAACIARIAGPDGDKGERFTSPETTVLLRCAHCSRPMHFDGFSFSRAAVLFVCSLHGMFSFSNDRGLVPELD